MYTPRRGSTTITPPPRGAITPTPPPFGRGVGVILYQIGCGIDYFKVHPLVGGVGVVLTTIFKRKEEEK